MIWQIAGDDEVIALRMNRSQMKDRLDEEERDKSIVPSHCWGRERRRKKEGLKGEGRREGGAV